MTPERADQMLHDYKTFLGRCNYLEKLIEGLEREMRIWQHNLAADVASIGAQNLDGMPHGTKVGNPTERYGLMLASGYTPEGLEELRKQIRAYKMERKEKLITVTFVEAWLGGLPMKQRWMIERQIFDGMTYAEINTLYRQTFEEPCSKDTLRRLRKDALANIYKMAK